MSFQPNDEISRCIIFNKAFNGLVHTNQLLFVFPSENELDHASHESCISRALAPLDVDVHKFGCWLAAKQNTERGEPTRGPKRRYYCGFRTANYGDLKLVGDGYKVVLNLSEEDGNKAHIDVALFIEAQTRNERRTIKLDAALKLANAFTNPIAYICDVDSGDPNHPLMQNPNCLTEDLEMRPLFRKVDLPAYAEGQGELDSEDSKPTHSDLGT